MKIFQNMKIRSRATNIILACVLPVWVLMLVEYFTHVPSDLTTIIFVVNLCAYYLVYLFFFFLSGRLDVGYSLATVFFLLFGLLNYVVMAFRSTPVVPWDIYSIRTAVSVAGNYKLEPDSHFIVSFLGLFLLILISSRMSGKKIVSVSRIAGTVVSAVFIFLYTTAVGSAAVISFAGLDTILFTPKVLYRNNGLVTGFLGVMKYLWVEKPKGYSESYLEELIGEYEPEEAEDDLPNVIVIMNEAFSDLAVYGDFETDQPYMPFIDSMDQNTWKGFVYTSVKGGNTANSEFEFLTGNSVAFVPAGSVPYQQYVKSPIPSLAYHLKGLGYQSAAIHPYQASGWNRNTVYPLLGFDQQLFKTDFHSPETLRGYVTDKESFHKIVELYEEKEEGRPLFAFEVTMQNHGGYSKEYEDLTEEVHITALADKNTQVRAAEKYLTLIKKTDEAWKELVEYFSEQDEKTILLMFGDHQPSDYITNVFARLNGLDTTAESTIHIGYKVPYIMWTNFDVEESAWTDMSVNYLSTALCDMGGIPLTGYQQYEMDLYDTYHVISANQILDVKGKLMEYDLDDEEINDYACLCYQLLCDKKNENWDFYVK